MTRHETPTRDYAVVALLVGVFTGAAGVSGGITVLGKNLYDLTGRELDLGLLGLVEFAPAALLVLVTGMVADRYNRRKVAAYGFIAAGLPFLGIAAYVSTPSTSTVPIFMFVLLFGIARAFARPAARSLPADIIAAERLPAFTGRWSLAMQTGIIVGPVAGGFVYSQKPALAYVMVAFLFLLDAASFLTLRNRVVSAQPDRLATETANVKVSLRERWHEAIGGIRVVRERPLLLGAISLDLFAVLFGGAIALLPAIADRRLGVDVVGLGWLRAAGGMGAAAVTLLLATRPLRSRIGPALFAAVVTFGVFTILLGATRSFTVACIAMAVLSGADAVSVYVRGTLVPLATPENKRGRVLALETVFIGASNELGAMESGVVGQALGAAPAIVVGGAATVGIAALWWTLFPSLRRLSTFPTRGAPATEGLLGGELGGELGSEVLHPAP